MLDGLRVVMEPGSCSRAFGRSLFGAGGRRFWGTGRRRSRFEALRVLRVGGPLDSQSLGLEVLDGGAGLMVFGHFGVRRLEGL